MNKRPLRKLAGLTVLYILIFFAIIVIQFKNETIINESFGPFNVILSETKNEDNLEILKNEFQIKAGELTFYSDALTPVKIIIGEAENNLILKSWQKKSDTCIQLDFDNAVSIVFETPEGNAIPLEIRATMPSEATGIQLPYRLETLSTVETQDESTILINDRDRLYRMKAALLSDSTISLNDDISSFSITEYAEITRFSFDSLVDLEEANVQTYTAIRNQIQDAIINFFPDEVTENTVISEKAVVARIAEMASQGKYSQAIKSLTAYSKNSGRTYISTPYFNSLASMNKTLTFNLNSLNSDIKTELEKKSLGIFTNTNFMDKCVTINRNTLKEVLNLADSAMKNQPDSIQPRTAAGILTVFNRLEKYSIKEADILRPHLEALADIIEQNSALDEDNVLSITSGTKPLDFMEKIRMGFALADTGSYLEDASLQAAGRLLINKTITGSGQLSIETIAELYPLFVPANAYYPHIVLLAEHDDGSTTWAWTIAQNVTYEATENTINLGTTFLTGEIHHMILRGIEKFSSINIWGMNYNTDPRFESYNAPGYVYESDTSSLLLKYRHKTDEEIVKLTYSK